MDPWAGPEAKTRCCDRECGPRTIASHLAGDGGGPNGMAQLPEHDRALPLRGYLLTDWAIHDASNPRPRDQGGRSRIVSRFGHAWIGHTWLEPAARFMPRATGA